MSLDDLYQEVILDHFNNPRCRGELERPDVRSELFNPLCGDRIELRLEVQGGHVVDVGFDGKGCSISQASASMMGELCKGKTLHEVEQYSKLFQEMLKKQCDEEELVQLGDAKALQGVRAFPARMKCAMLAWEAMEKCIKKFHTDES